MSAQGRPKRELAPERDSAEGRPVSAQGSTARHESGGETIDRVIALVGELIQDWGLDLDSPLSGATLLAADLEFASVDIIQLCVALEKSYGCRFGFQDLLMK